MKLAIFDQKWDILEVLFLSLGLKMYNFYFKYWKFGLKIYRILIVSWFECLVQSGKNNTLKKYEKYAELHFVWSCYFDEGHAKVIVYLETLLLELEKFRRCSNV